MRPNRAKPPPATTWLRRALLLLLAALVLHALRFAASRRRRRAAPPSSGRLRHLAAPNASRNAVLSLPVSGVAPFFWEARYVGREFADDAAGEAFLANASAAAEDAPPSAPVFEDIAFIFDACYVCGTRSLVLVGRAERRVGMDRREVFSAVRAAVLDAEGAALHADIALLWDAQLVYESVALGTRRMDLEICGGGSGGASARAPHLFLRLDYGPSLRWHATQPLHVVRAPVAPAPWFAAARARPRVPEGAFLLPAPAVVPYAMCTTVMTASDLVRLWVRYYTLKGVGAFYLYCVAPTAAETRDLVVNLERILSKMWGGAAVTLVPWPFPMFSSGSDANYAQPAALNSCAARYGSAHEGLLFYDVDEFLVTKAHNTIAEWLRALRARYGPTPTLVTSMAWALVGPTPQDFNFSIPAFRNMRSRPRPAPLLRSPANCSAGGDLFLCPLNCSHWAERGGPGRALRRRSYAPIPPPPFFDDDDRSAWAINDTVAERECWLEWAGGGSGGSAALPSPFPSPPPDWAHLALYKSHVYPYEAPARPLPSPLGLPPSRLSILGLLSAPITRTAVKLGGGREKYIVPNATATLLKNSPVAVNIHGIYSQRTLQVALQPEDGYHLHFLNDNRSEASAVRIAAFLYHYSTKEREDYKSGPGVAPPEPHNVEERLYIDTDFADALASAVRAAAERDREE